MRIAIFHNSYQQYGGEDQVVANESALLREHGHDVRIFEVSSSQIKSPIDKIKAAWNLSYSTESRQMVLQWLSDFKPDVAHVHNFFPLLTPSIYDAFQAARVPVVQTLHNYRLICANAKFLKKGSVCEKCLVSSSWNAVMHSCYRDSALKTIPLAWMIHRSKKADIWNTKVSRFIALTDFAKTKFVEAGIKPSKISVKGNFSIHPNRTKLTRVQRSSTEKVGLFVGRLSHEKGIRTLLKAWEGLPFRLRIVGKGPLLSEIRREAGDNIEVVGPLNRNEIWRAYEESDFFVLPSEWYEGFPMVVAEAYAAGVPVVASRVGGVPELVEDGRTGLLFGVGDVEELRKKVQQIATDDNLRSKLVIGARRQFDEKFNPMKNYEQLHSIYSQVIEEEQVQKLTRPRGSSAES